MIFGAFAKTKKTATTRAARHISMRETQEEMTARALFPALIAALLLLTVIYTASGANPTWYLDSEDRFTDISDDFYMWKGSTAECSGSVQFPLLNGERIWIADEAAQCDVAFPAGTWNGNLHCSAGIALTLNANYEIGVYNLSNHQFTAKGTNTTEIILKLSSPTTHPFKIETNEPFTVIKGEYLAFRIGTDLTLGIGNKILTDGNSWIESPVSAPEYPVPELATIALFSIGLVVFAGLALYRRRGAG